MSSGSVRLERWALKVISQSEAGELVDDMQSTPPSRSPFPSVPEHLQLHHFLSLPTLDVMIQFWYLFDTACEI